MQDVMQITGQQREWLTKISQINNLKMFEELASLFTDDGFLEFIEADERAQNAIRELFSEKVPSWSSHRDFWPYFSSASAKDPEKEVFKILAKIENKRFIFSLTKFKTPLKLIWSDYSIGLLDKECVESFNRAPWLILIFRENYHALIKNYQSVHYFFFKNLEKILKIFGDSLFEGVPRKIDIILDIVRLGKVKFEAASEFHRRF